MAKQYQYEVTTYAIEIRRAGFGWLELKDNVDLVGYIYFGDDPSPKDRFGGDRPYIVMHQPIQMWSTIIDILRNEKPLYISGYQSDAAAEVSAAFGTGNAAEPVGEGKHRAAR